MYRSSRDELAALPGPGIPDLAQREPTVNDYLTVAEIALGTGLSESTIQKAARRDGWGRQPERTGRRGRPRFRYLLADALASLGFGG